MSIGIVTPAGVDTSAAAATPPIIAAVVAAASASMSAATTFAPAEASAAAMALPMPDPAPVTTATDPSIFTTSLYHWPTHSEQPAIREPSGSEPAGISHVRHSDEPAAPVIVGFMNTPVKARRAGVVVTLAGAFGVSAFLGCAVANAGGHHGSTSDVKVGVQSAPGMKLQTSADEKVNSTGVQGDLRTSAIQGTVENALQCDSTSSIAKVDCDTLSPEATPQTKAK